MIVALNTAEAQHELALLRENPSNKGEYELIGEKVWMDERRHEDVFTPHLKQLLEEAGLAKEDITTLVCVKGPGTFTSLRMGVAFANALAAGLTIPLCTLNTFQLLRRKAALASPTLVVLYAGRDEVGAQLDDEPVRVGPIAQILNDYPHGAISVVADVPEALSDTLHSIILEKKWRRVEGHELQSMGEMLMTFGLSELETVQTIEPYYLKGPHITKSADPWKQ